MIINLFSVFDPSTSIINSINWFRRIWVYLFFPFIYWFIPSRWNYFYLIILNFLTNEIKVLLNSKLNIMNLIIYISLFFIVLLNNFIGLFPYVFTSSAHLVISLGISLTLWLSFILYGWIINLNNMFTHLVPQGTPGVLIPFIVLIETISNVIRPGTLAVRLSANIIAGHLLITLISSTGTNLRNIILIFMLLRQRILIILELSVSIIQAYVISILRTLYRTESNYEKIISTFSFSNT